MILKADAAQLEWRVKVFLAQDQVGIEEIQFEKDIHTDNQTFFRLPSRLIAKIFIYRMIFADAFGERGFGGPAWSYANDAQFQPTSSSPKYWEKVVERFFEKYKGIYQHSVDSIRLAVDTGQITTPSGCRYSFSPVLRRGRIDWPRTAILNYPVQGFAAHLMVVARSLFWEKVPELRLLGPVLPINTVHDDIEADVDNDPNLIYNTCIELENAFAGIPNAFEKKFGSKINVPMAGEVKYGMSLDEDKMHKFKRETFFDDYQKYFS